MAENKYSIEDIKEVLVGNFPKDSLEKLSEDALEFAGDHLHSRIIEVLGKEKDAILWFYSSISLLGDVSPYQKCIEGKQEEVNCILDQMEYGDFA